MNSFNSMRRDLLRVGSLGFAGAAIPAVSFAAQPARQTPPLRSSAVFNVRQYGASGDGKTLDTDAVNRTIELPHPREAEWFFFPRASIFASPSVSKATCICISSRARPSSPPNRPSPAIPRATTAAHMTRPSQKPTWDAYQDYGHNHWHNSLIWGEDMHDFSITGPGLIWGKGLSFGAGPGRAASTEVRGFFTEPVGRPGATGQPAPAASGTPPPQPERHFNPRGDYPMYQAEQPGVGNKAIALKNCRNVLLRDFSVLKGGHFAPAPHRRRQPHHRQPHASTPIATAWTSTAARMSASPTAPSTRRGTTASAPSPATLLATLRATRNVTIANCFVTGCYQLGTVLDGTWKKFPEGGRPYGTGRIKCGTESNGGFINITITGCVFEGCQGYALETVDGALLEDITISNTTMRDLISGPLFMRLGVRLRGPKDTTKVGTLKRILVSNLNCHNAPMRISSILSGIPSNAIEDVKLSNIFIETVGGATADAEQDDETR